MSCLRRTSRLSATLLLTLLAACGGGDNSALDMAVIGTPQDSPGTSSAKPLNDPLMGRLVRAATAEGLVSFDEQGRVIPALADRWIVTDDGHSYIFRLRDGNWSNGDPITARFGKNSTAGGSQNSRKHAACR